MNANPPSLSSSLRQYKKMQIDTQYQQLPPLPSPTPPTPLVPPSSPQETHSPTLLPPLRNPHNPKVQRHPLPHFPSPSLPVLLSDDSSRPSTIAPLRTYLSPRVYCTSPLYSMLRRLARLRERLRVIAGSVLVVYTAATAGRGTPLSHGRHS